MIITLDGFYQMLESYETEAKSKHDLYFRAYSSFSFLDELINIFGRDLIIKWLNQFSDDDREIALKLFLDIKYFNEDLFRMLCQISYFEYVSKTKTLGNDTLFIGVGGTGKSGQMVAYLFRTTNNIPTDKFKYIEEVTDEELQNTKNIVFLDDIIGSGKQFIDYFNDFVAPKITGKSLNLYLISITGTERGVLNINTEINGINVIIPHKRTIKSYNSDEVKVIRKYGEGLSRNPLGWKNSGETIIFFYNVPNNTLPIFWSTNFSRVIGKEWTPLKKRATTVGRKVSQKKILEVLRQFLVKDEKYAHEFMLAMSIIIESYTVLNPGDLSSEELFNFAKLISNYFAPYEGQLSKGAIFECLPNVRKEIASIFCEQILTTGLESEFNDFLKLFILDEFTYHQDDALQPRLVNLTLSIINKFPDFEDLIINKMISKEPENRLLVHGCYLVLKNRHLKEGLHQNTINKISEYRKKGENSARYFSELLLSKIRKTAPDFSDVNINKVFKLRNFYGSIKILSVSDINKYPH